MKTKEIKDEKFSKGFTINIALTGKYNDDPFFVAKAEKAKKLLEKHPIPEHLLHSRK